MKISSKIHALSTFVRILSRDAVNPANHLSRFHQSLTRSMMELSRSRRNWILWSTFFCEFLIKNNFYNFSLREKKIFSSVREQDTDVIPAIEPIEKPIDSNNCCQNSCKKKEKKSFFSIFKKSQPNRNPKPAEDDCRTIIQRPQTCMHHCEKNDERDRSATFSEPSKKSACETPKCRPNIDETSITAVSAERERPATFSKPSKKSVYETPKYKPSVAETAVTAVSANSEEYDQIMLRNSNTAYALIPLDELDKLRAASNSNNIQAVYDPPRVCHKKQDSGLSEEIEYDISTEYGEIEMCGDTLDQVHEFYGKDCQYTQYVLYDDQGAYDSFEFKNFGMDQNSCYRQERKSVSGFLRKIF